MSFVVISHRGRKTGEKENSIAAFEKAIKMGAEGIECDARLTFDNEVIIIHDRVSETDKEPLTLPELFLYIKKKEAPFFIEVKSSSKVLIEKIIEEIEKEDLWQLVHAIGFSTVIKTALKAQEKYPKLRVMPFVNFPPFSFIKVPQKSYGLFLGWIDEWRGSQFLFRKLIPQQRLEKLVKLYKKNGFKVMAGVINNEKGLRYFKNAGITDIVTDEIELTSKILK
ncbi:MAG: hypothetical protein A3H50_00965 [Candidatus Levybacteria bacterium RIFCSPLOWO2_02_FULL_37_10]|nr:MAG: hypothetical protein A2860_00270 [Candidatus Levybacteria bacterium RIFCSPHIGHO2_01_FULL_37_33]OGH29004.1 MAG: hypothetical protein A3F30_04120 [Candidatus Levybacteria bacterium RIFCSPHIGHO2_12_FULL_37_12]OGH46157.1 MAG: hypothetical protein A3H50_00965 [Candidatus Levybacteria bacterium RIFCSPLOWO2_02_FULL_37_10]